MILGIWVANANPAAAHQTEAGFRAAVVELAEALGWLVYYVPDSRRCAPGYPDLSLLHPGQGRFLVAELKRERGRVTPEQRVWLEGLRRAGVAAYLWRPSDWPQIEATLKGKE